MLILNLGCGVNRRRLYESPFEPGTIHVDKNPDVGPDLVRDLNEGLPMGMDRNGKWVDFWNSVDEIHAYHLVEHIGVMGDTTVWFRFWRSCWNSLKPGGKMYVIAPYYLHEDAVGDPTHTRLIGRQTFVFLDRASYLKKDGEPGCAQSKIDIDFDLPADGFKWVVSQIGDPVPCGIKITLSARKTQDGGLVPIEELQNQRMEAASV